MAETKQETCEQRILGELAGRIEQIAALHRILDATDLDELGEDDLNALEASQDEMTLKDAQETAEERLRELPLGVSVKRVLGVELSWGGPQDYIEVEIGPNGELESTPVYHFLDWFDGAQQTTEDKDIERFMEYYAETVDPTA